YDDTVFDPLGIYPDKSLGTTWEGFVGLLSRIFESASSTKKEKSPSARGVAALSRLGIYVPLGGVNRDAFVGNLDQNSLLSTSDSFSGGGIGRLGICSLGIVPFINAQIVFQLLAQIYPKLQELQKREGEAGRKKVLQYTRYASVGFAIEQAIGQVVYLRPYVNDFSTEWVLSSVVLLIFGSVFTTFIGERISDLKLGNGTSL
ncbi:SecY/SEC61-alpha family, partial [Dillenia turbinata]